MPYQSHYDTVILGAGLGGLVTGTLLTKTGQKVMVLEEKPYPGGSSILTHREGYPFTSSPILLLGLEKDGYCDQLFSELGLSLAMQKRPGGLLRRPSPILQIVTDPYRVNLHINREEQLAEYKREWGEAAGALQQFYKQLDLLGDMAYPFYYKKNLPGPSVSPSQMIGEVRQAIKRNWAIHAQARSSAMEYLHQYQFPREILQIFNWLNFLWRRSDLEQSTALDFQLLMMLISREVTRPLGGMVKFCELLAKIFLEHRGEIRYQQAITSVKRETRKTWVMTLANGEDIRAHHLVIHLPWDVLEPAAHGVLTFYFSIDAQVVPAPMGNQILLYRPQPQAPLLENPLLVVLSLPDEERAYIEKKRLLMVTLHFPKDSPPDEEGLRQYLHGIIKNLHWLMPFSEGKIQYLGNDLQDRQQQAKRLEKTFFLLKRLKWVKQPYLEYSYPSSDRDVFILPDHSGSPAMLTTEVRSAEDIAKQLLKRR